MNLFYSLLFYYICDFLRQSQYLTLIFCIRSIQLCLQIEHQNSFSCLSLSPAFMTTNHLTVNNINVHENRNESKIQYTKYIKHWTAEIQEAEWSSYWLLRGCRCTVPGQQAFSTRERSGTRTRRFVWLWLLYRCEDTCAFWKILLFKCTSCGLFSEDSFTMRLSSSPFY